MVIRVCVSGARGKMGRLLCELLLQDGDLVLSAALERPRHPELGMSIGPKVELSENAREALGQAEVLLDFSLPEAVAQHAELCEELSKPLVTGTTGFSSEQLALLRRVAGKVPVVHSSNMSRGVYVLAKMAASAAQSLAGYDVEILEIHHRQKADAPSGTALQLAEAVKLAGKPQKPIYGRSGKRQPQEIGIAALRGGDVVGEHQVMFLGGGEQILLTHRATSREHFCRGALDAVRFVAKAPKGLYTMEDVFTTGSRY